MAKTTNYQTLRARCFRPEKVVTQVGNENAKKQCGQIDAGRFTSSRQIGDLRKDGRKGRGHEGRSETGELPSRFTTPEQ